MNSLHTKTSVFILLFSASLFSSCTNRTDTEKTPEPEKKVEEKKAEVQDMGSFKPGTWKIDSVAENNQIVDRLNEKNTIQVFHFRRDGVFAVMEIKTTSASERPTGKWEVKRDSVFVLSENGDVSMSYGYRINGKVLTLNGNFNVSAENKNKPSFYLSKYEEKW